MKKHQKIIDDKKTFVQKMTLFGFIALTLVLLALRLVLANSYIDQSVEVSRLEAKIDKIDTENQSLRQNIREESSLSSLGPRAASLGFVKTTYSYLPTNPSVALRVF